MVKIAVKKRREVSVDASDDFSDFCLMGSKVLYMVKQTTGNKNITLVSS